MAFFIGGGQTMASQSSREAKCVPAVGIVLAAAYCRIADLERKTCYQQQPAEIIKKRKHTWRERPLFKVCNVV